MIEVRPIETKKWHGKRGQEDFSRPKKIPALVDPNTMKYAVGLSDSELEELGKELKADLSTTFIPDTPHPFWDTNQAVVKLDNKTMFLDPSKPLDRIKYGICKGSKYVANSMKEYNDGFFPEATHAIFNEAEEAELKANKIEIKNSVVKKVGELSKSRKIEIIMILKKKNLKNQSDNFVTVAMDELVQERPLEVLRLIEDQSKEFITNYALVIEAIQKSVLRKEGHKIKYFDDTIGISEEDVAEYLIDPQNQDLKLMLMEKVNE